MGASEIDLNGVCGRLCVFLFVLFRCVIRCSGPLKLRIRNEANLPSVLVNSIAWKLSADGLKISSRDSNSLPSTMQWINGPCGCDLFKRLVCYGGFLSLRHTSHSLLVVCCISSSSRAEEMMHVRRLYLRFAAKSA